MRQGQYKTPAGWVEPQHRQETIHVKGKPDLMLDVVTTRHGPIITELLPGETRKIALRWTLHDGMGLMFFDVDSAQNWNEFRKAFSNFRRARTERDVRRCRWSHRISGDGPRADPRVGRRQPAGERQR